MTGYVLGVLSSSWNILLEASIFIIIGLLIAAMLRAFISSESIIKYIGGNNIKSVLLAALFGVPLPLCSCGVVPAAIALRRQGASKSAALSFLISTPESSIDSIAITYALIDPLMAIFRPFAAFVSGFTAGIGEILFGKKEDTKKPDEIECPHCESHNPPIPPPLEKGGGESVVPPFVKGGEGGFGHYHPLSERLSSGLRFAFIELLSDISRWFLIGMLIAGIISYAIPTSFIENYLGEGWTSMFIMLAAGLPLYVCATASTPIAAALILKGMSPGAALVFLLAGPATNATSFTVLAKMLGKRTAIIYLLSISVSAILLGMFLNWLYHFLGINIHSTTGHAHEMIPIWLKWATAIPLTLAMIVGAIYKK